MNPRRAACFLASVLVVSVPLALAQSLSVLYSFTATGGDGAEPYAGVILDSAGNLYGTTYAGGDFNCTDHAGGCGIVFELDMNGSETILHSFAGGPADGAFPESYLARDEAGNLYGTTTEGGTSQPCSPYVYLCGTVFKLSSTGAETVLYNFGEEGGFDGAVPLGNLVRDRARNLYGVTNRGGFYDRGTVFKLDVAGMKTVFYSFKGGGRDGEYPTGGLARDAAGNLYGTTFYGGDIKCYGPYGCGTIFRVTESGKETVLHIFAGGASDGKNPAAGLLRDAAGNLYGTTYYGGSSTACIDGCGTVFKLDTTGTLTLLHSFAGSPTDGALPQARLYMDSAGNLYGTTNQGGGSTSCPSGCGTVFKLDTTGAETVLHSFAGPPDGEYPYAGLISDAAGNLYGTTYLGGTSTTCTTGCGTVFKLTP